MWNVLVLDGPIALLYPALRQQTGIETLSEIYLLLTIIVCCSKTADMHHNPTISNTAVRFSIRLLALVKRRTSNVPRLHFHAAERAPKCSGDSDCRYRSLTDCMIS